MQEAGKGHLEKAENGGGRDRAVRKWLEIWEAGKGHLESGWEYRRQGKSGLKGGGMEEAGGWKLWMKGEGRLGR